MNIYQNNLLISTIPLDTEEEQSIINYMEHLKKQKQLKNSTPTNTSSNYKSMIANQIEEDTELGYIGSKENSLLLARIDHISAQMDKWIAEVPNATLDQELDKLNAVVRNELNLFSQEQIEVIHETHQKDFDIVRLADPNLDEYKMEQILRGWESGVDVLPYIDYLWEEDQISFIRESLEMGLDVSEYALSSLTTSEMFDMRDKQLNGPKIIGYGINHRWEDKEGNPKDGSLESFDHQFKTLNAATAFLEEYGTGYCKSYSAPIAVYDQPVDLKKNNQSVIEKLYGHKRQQQVANSQNKSNFQKEKEMSL